MQRRSLRPSAPLVPIPEPLAASAVPTSCLASVMRSATLTTTKFPNVATALFAFVSFTVVPFILCMTANVAGKGCVRIPAR